MRCLLPIIIGTFCAAFSPAQQSTNLVETLWAKQLETLAVERLPEMEANEVKAAGKTMRLLEKRFGEKPKTGWSLFISMHGGGGAPARVNDGQWKNQIRLYQPKEGIVVAPRAPTDTWNLWHQAHMDTLMDRLIENYVVLAEVNPDRVYLLGYSAGGDGVYQLAPRLADRFAAASMMAGHPNDANPLGLRNLPFMIWCGEKDAAYKRNQVAKKWGTRLDDLATEDPEGYVHKTMIVKGAGHWMNGSDRAAIPWMSKYQRDPWPKKVVWHQSGRTHTRFYWLQNSKPVKGQTIRATVEDQTITIKGEGIERLSLRLSDALIDLDKSITVLFNEKQVHQGLVQRDSAVVKSSLSERADPRSAAVALLELQLN